MDADRGFSLILVVAIARIAFVAALCAGSAYAVYRILLQFRDLVVGLG